MRALSLYAGMLVVAGLIGASPPARADAVASDQSPPVVDYPKNRAAEPTSLSLSAALAGGLLVAWKLRRGRDN